MGFKSTAMAASPGIFVTKSRIVIFGIVLLVLIILVIVLGALLGHARSQLKGDGSQETIKETIKETPTASSTTKPGSTTPGTEVWWNVRLPKNIIPDHYDILLTIDLKKLEFSGEVTILVNVTEPTKDVLVHVNKMNITSASVKKASDGDPLSTEKMFLFEKNQFYVMVMESALEKGQYMITMEFKAFLTGDLAGLYKSTYTRKDGTSVTIAATQFQPTDARRAFPCFDEPALKATFTVTLVHDPTFIAISNMPIKDHTLKGNWRYDYFQKTKVMPTYLLAFVVCDFKGKTVTSKRGTNMTFYAPKDQIDQVDYAAGIGVEMLDYMEDYFSIPYPLPKADMIAIPDFAAGAMENWGLMLYRETALLYDYTASSASNKQRVATVVSHELAHQWFGNLVTMKWWDDLWLNEGFASFVEYYGVNATHPEWKMLDQFVVTDMVAAFQLDGLESSHPIKVPVFHPDEINEIFDSISYNKGSTVIRMLEYFLGRNVFLKGLTNYLNKYQYGNAETDDLWNALEMASCQQGSCKSVKQMMDTWTLQMGYPVLHIKDIGGGKFSVTQGRFLYDSSANVTSKYQSKFNYTWVVPFTYFTKANTTPISEPLNMTSVEITWDGNGWLKGNAGQTGFYRVNYEQAQWDQLTNQMATNHQTFKARDRAGLIDDAFNLARAGIVSYPVALNLTKYIKKEDELVPWEAVDINFDMIASILPRSSTASKRLKKYLEFQANDQYQKLGFRDVGTHLDAFKRIIVLTIMCDAGEATCLKKASDYFSEWMKDPLRSPVPANFRSLVYHYGIANGGRKEWDFAFDQFKKTTIASERRKILYGLSASREPWILQRFLEYSLDPTKIKSQDTSRVLTNVANLNPIGRQLAWQFIKSNWATILKRFGGGFFAIRNVILGVTKGFATDYELNQLKEFIDSNPNAGSGSRAQQQALERVKANVKWRKDNEQDFEDWLGEFLASNNLLTN